VLAPPLAEPLVPPVPAEPMLPPVPAALPLAPAVVPVLPIVPELPVVPPAVVPVLPVVPVPPAVVPVLPVIPPPPAVVPVLALTPLPSERPAVEGMGLTIVAPPAPPGSSRVVLLYALAPVVFRVAPEAPALPSPMMPTLCACAASGHANATASAAAAVILAFMPTSWKGLTRYAVQPLFPSAARLSKSAARRS
jgi:hypothetical protein